MYSVCVPVKWGARLSTDVRELLDTLKEVEKKLIAVHDVRIGVIYLTWGIALAGFAILQSVMMGVIPYSATITYVSITHWAAVTALGAAASMRLERIMQAYMSKHSRSPSRASWLVRLISIAGWVTAAIVGWVIVPILLGPHLAPAGCLIFLAVGNFSVYAAVVVGYGTRANSIATASAGLALLSIPSGLLASISYTAAWDFTVALATMVYLLVSMHHFRRSIHILY